jgi:hypothetical protein
MLASAMTLHPYLPKNKIMLKRYIRKNIYKWHRWSSLIVAIPVLLWTISGFLYPILNTKPNVPAASLSPIAIEREQVTVSLQQALALNNIDSIQNFRIVQIKTGFYYQVEQTGKTELLYIDCRSGSILPGGDQLYAIWLAHRMMTEKPNGGHSGHASHSPANAVQFASGSRSPEPSFTPVLSISRITSFNKEYKAGQRILPVYKIALDRADGLRLYIDTRASRLSVAIDNRKAWFDRFFGITHTWSFLDDLGKAKHVVLGIFSTLCLFTAISGLYVYLVIHKKKSGSKQKKNPVAYMHRLLGYIFLLTTALYGFSGAWHAFRKAIPSNMIKKDIDHSFSYASLALSLDAIKLLVQPEEKLADISVVQFNDKIYWQMTCRGKDNVVSKKYIDAASGMELPEGDMSYACWLACRYSNKKDQRISSVTCVRSFNQRYGMMNKILPVVQVSFDEESYFIETTTGSLITASGLPDAAERFSFSNFHMHKYPETWWGSKNGKRVKNIILISSTLGLLLAAFTGTLIYLRRRFYKRNSPSQKRRAGDIESKTGIT